MRYWIGEKSIFSFSFSQTNNALCCADLGSIYVIQSFLQGNKNKTPGPQIEFGKSGGWMLVFVRGANIRLYDGVAIPYQFFNVAFGFGIVNVLKEKGADISAPDCLFV